MGVVNPQFTKSEFFMRYDLNSSFINLVSFAQIFSNLFLKDCIIKPNIDISPPKSFFLKRGDNFDSSFVNFSGFLYILERFFEKD